MWRLVGATPGIHNSLAWLTSVENGGEEFFFFLLQHALQSCVFAILIISLFYINK